MKKFNKILSASAATLMLTLPMYSAISNVHTVSAIQATQSQQQELVALGASLSDQQAQETLQLLGAGGFPAGQIKYVDGNIINQYLQDGSNSSTVVYSSAFIQQMPEGHGVQVQIVTPQNILNVSQLTYQNAAITAGAKNAQIRVATVEPVTGEGALAGVYALLAQSGVEVKTEDVAVAQKEITLVNELEKQTGLNNTQVNQAVAEVKTEITNNIVNQTEVNETVINNIIVSVIEEKGIDPEEHPEIVDELKDYAKEYSQTDAAANEDTIQQLQESTTPVWSDALTQLDPSLTYADAQARPRLDFSQDDNIMPEIQSLTSKFYNDLDQALSPLANYSYSFVLESLNPEMTTENKQALNALRTEIFYHLNGQWAEMFGSSQLQSQWMENLNSFENLKLSDPVLAEIYLQIGIQTGLMPQAYSYHVMDQEGSIVFIDVVEDAGDHINTSHYKYDIATGTVLDAVTDTPVTPMDYTSIFGKNLEDLRSNPVTIPADYQVPENYLENPQSSESETTVEDETTTASEAVEDTTATEEVTSQEDVISEDDNQVSEDQSSAADQAE